MSERRVTVSQKLVGAGHTTYELHEAVIRDGQVFVDNGPGNDESGPFDVQTGRDLRDLPFLGLTFSLVFDNGKAAREYEGDRP